jgi:hypothetical protein
VKQLILFRIDIVSWPAGCPSLIIESASNVDSGELAEHYGVEVKSKQRNSHLKAEGILAKDRAWYSMKVV